MIYGVVFRDPEYVIRKNFHSLTRRDNSLLPLPSGSTCFSLVFTLSIKLFQWLTTQFSDDKFVNSGAQDKAALTPFALRVCCLCVEWSRDLSALQADVWGAGSWEKHLVCFQLTHVSPGSVLSVPAPHPFQETARSPCRWDSCQFPSGKQMPFDLEVHFLRCAGVFRVLVFWFSPQIRWLPLSIWKICSQI